jgi:chemosensory pili system protein ChpA (sensor histidine kinase/response regulator)
MTRVLLVDDEATVRRILSLALTTAGFDVKTAANGEEALEQIRQRRPEVLITDVEMPRMDGHTLCETLRSEMPDRDFPIFVVTSLTQRDLREWSGEIENLHFLEKPISVRTLLARLDEHLHGKGVAAVS